MVFSACAATIVPPPSLTRASRVLTAALEIARFGAVVVVVTAASIARFAGRGTAVLALVTRRFPESEYSRERESLLAFGWVRW